MCLQQNMGIADVLARGSAYGITYRVVLPRFCRTLRITKKNCENFCLGESGGYESVRSCPAREEVHRAEKTVRPKFVRKKKPAVLGGKAGSSTLFLAQTVGSWPRFFFM